MSVTGPPPALYVDGHNLLHRAAFGFPARITSRSGRDITLVFGFFALIRAAARNLDTPPPEVIVVLDGQDGAAERRALLPQYKPPVTGDEEAFADLPRIHEGLNLLGIHWIEDNKWEADDVIASLITAQPAREHLIMSTDKDFYQLLSPRVSVLNTQRRADRRRIHPVDVHDKHGVLPHQFIDAERVAVAGAEAVQPTGRASTAQMSVYGGLLLRGANAAARQGRTGAATDLLADATAMAQRTGADRTDFEVIFGPSNVIMQTADCRVVAENYVEAAEVARRMPRDSALPLISRGRHLADVAHAELRLGHTQAAESALLTMERTAPEWTSHHQLPRVLVGELMTQGRPSTRLRELADRLNTTR